LSGGESGNLMTDGIRDIDAGFSFFPGGEGGPISSERGKRKRFIEKDFQ